MGERTFLVHYLISSRKIAEGQGRAFMVTPGLVTKERIVQWENQLAKRKGERIIIFSFQQLETER